MLTNVKGAQAACGTEASGTSTFGSATVVRLDNSTATANIIVCVIVLSLNLFAYYKMRDEGVEDGMTMMGKDFSESNAFSSNDDFFFKMYPAVTGVYVVLILIANYVTQA